MTKRVFITGIAGFIGFHLAKYLKARGDFVIGCDNFNSYYDPELKKARASILKELGIAVLEIDICETNALENILLSDGISHFVHLAAQAGVRHSIKDPHSYVHNNLDGFVKVLESVKRIPNIKFIYASSSSVYGLNTKVPFSESDMADAPASFYGATKKANELIAHSYHHIYGVPVTGLRYFTVYGPWGRPDMAYFSFTKAILEERPIHVYNGGMMKRDFTYIDDIVEGTAAAIDLEGKCEIFNLGNNRTEELLDLISFIEKYTGKKAVMEFLPIQPGDIPLTYADITKAQESLYFKPKVSLEAGIERFVEWYLRYCNTELPVFCSQDLK